tara:strand:+ start:898 stop:1494 length:597 start_codon:yes stop_codon:yes gene_type:complete
MGQAMTVTPDGYEDQMTGEFVYTDLQVDGSGNRDQMNVEFQQNQENNFSMDADGNAVYRNQGDANDQATLVSDFGGQEGVAQIQQWAADNLHPEEIAKFNYAVEKGDVSDIYFNFQAVKDMMDNDAYTGSEAHYDEDAELIFENLMPEEEYYDFVEEAREVLNQKNIDTFNNIMNTGSLPQKIEAINYVKGKLDEGKW